MNETNGVDGKILMIGVQVLVKFPVEVIYTTIYSIYQQHHRGHNKFDVATELQATLPNIARDYGSARKFLVLDGNEVNVGNDGIFTKYDGSSYAIRQSGYHFETAGGLIITPETPSPIKILTLLSIGDLNSFAVRKVLRTMARLASSDPLWTCLGPQPGDTDGQRRLKEVLMCSAEIYQMCLTTTIGEAKQKIVQYIELHKDFIYIEKGKQSKKRRCWKPDTDSYFKELILLPDDVPLQSFTLCCDENLGDASLRLVGGKFHAGASSRALNKTTIEHAFKVLCDSGPMAGHSTFGDCSYPVQFFVKEN